MERKSKSNRPRKAPFALFMLDDAEKFKMRHATAHTNISEPERMESDNSKPSTVPLAAPSQW